MVRKTLCFVATIASIAAASTEGGFFITQDVLERMAGAGPVNGVYTLQQTNNGNFVVSNDTKTAVTQNQGTMEFKTDVPYATPLYAPTANEVNYATEEAIWSQEVSRYESQNQNPSTFVPIAAPVVPVGDKEGTATKPIATADAKKAATDKKNAVDTKKKGVKSGVALGALGAMAVFSMML
ncbi:hypothetical protein HK407_01g01160 [Ordospora pajunii]|uniref:uncharacterized protein n=1 Tax=Ordospora pajunii TaxID=3039483 RepID=UPI00295281E8|nr:uncharacterized protein HK407_01g01160 [Ordospora pajunii]KAH9412223.1 hypothetical protein HK407_01g01160 [Ordospora pajunii]